MRASGSLAGLGPCNASDREMNYSNEKCRICDDLMSSFDSLSLDCKHIFHRKCLESNRIFKIVQKSNFVCPVTSCQIPIRENIFNSPLYSSVNEIQQKPFFSPENIKTANEVSQEESVNEIQQKPFFSPATKIANEVSQEESVNEIQQKTFFSPENIKTANEVSQEESLRLQKSDKIEPKSLDALSPSKYYCRNEVETKAKYLTHSDWKTTKKCLLCKNFLSEGKTYKLFCKHTYHLSCLIKRSNIARADFRENTCPLTFCKRSIPYLYGNID